MQRPPMVMVAPDSLDESERTLFGADTEVSVDDLYLYLNSTLPLMHQLDETGAPNLLLLRGMVAPELYEEAAFELAKSEKQAKKNFIVQNLIITRIQDVVVDKERGRVNAYVKGYLAIIVQSRGKNVILPYRADVIMDMQPPSRLNRFPFQMLKRQWKVGQTAMDWDGTRESEQKH